MRLMSTDPVQNLHQQIRMHSIMHLNDYDLLQRFGLTLGHWSHAHLFVTVIENAVILLHEHVAHDPQRPMGRGNINWHEGEEALARDAKHIIICSEGEALATKRDVQVRER